MVGKNGLCAINMKKNKNQCTVEWWGKNALYAINIKKNKNQCVVVS
jgi:hypothetical protein